MFVYRLTEPIDVFDGLTALPDWLTGAGYDTRPSHGDHHVRSSRRVPGAGLRTFCRCGVAIRVDPSM